MEKLTREIKTTEVYGYRANDGTFFSSEAECRKYEESAKCVLFAFYKGKVLHTVSGYKIPPYFGWDEQYIELLDLSSVDVILKINQYFYHINHDNPKDILNTDDVGKQIWVVHDGEDNYYMRLGTTEEALSKIAEALKLDGSTRK